MNLHKLAKPSQKIMPALTLSCCNNPSPVYNRELTKNRNYHTSTVCRKNHYDILGVTPKASQTQIKTAYYKLSKQFHPDVNKSDGAKKQFSEISEAYEVLGNKARRRLYDNVTHGSGRTGGGMASAVRAKRVTTEYEDFANRAGQFKERPPGPVTGKTAQFDFDEFYRQHYGDVLSDTRHLRAKQKQFRERAKISEKTYQGRTPTHLYIVVSLLISIVLMKEIADS